MLLLLSVVLALSWQGESTAPRTFTDFVADVENIDRLSAKGLASRLGLMLSGPPGTGKSLLAGHVAARLSRPFYVVRLDSVISSLLGDTAKNIRTVFDYAPAKDAVLFLDEMDAIAKLRGDTQELGELKRVVNSFIQNLDSLGPQSIILAATNHEELLDSAVWRRFGYRVQLGFPAPDLRRQMWLAFLNPLTFSDRDVDLLVDLSEGFSGSDIHEVCRRLHRRNLTTQRTAELKDAFPILQNIGIGEGEDRRFIAAFKGQDADTIAKALRARNVKLYSHAALAHLLGISKATAYRRTLKEEKANGR